MDNRITAQELMEALKRFIAEHGPDARVIVVASGAWSYVRTVDHQELINQATGERVEHVLMLSEKWS